MAFRLTTSTPALDRIHASQVRTNLAQLGFYRAPGFGCAVNLSGSPFALPTGSEVLLASGPFDGGLLPADTAAWLTLPFDHHA